MSRQEKVTKEKAAPVHRHFVVALCCSPRKAAVELALVKRAKRGLKQSSPKCAGIELCKRNEE